MVWILINGNADVISLHYPLMSFYLSVFGFIGFCWLCYCIDSSPFIKLKRPWVKLVCSSPAIVVTVVMFLSILTGYAFSVNEDGLYVRGPLYLLQATIHVYFIAASIIASISKKNTSYATKKHKYTVLAFAAIPMLVLGTVQLILLCKEY